MEESARQEPVHHRQPGGGADRGSKHEDEILYPVQPEEELGSREDERNPLIKRSSRLPSYSDH